MLNSLKSDILGRDTVWFNCSSDGPVKGQALWPASDQTSIDRHKISAEVPPPRLARATAFPRGQLPTKRVPNQSAPRQSKCLSVQRIQRQSTPAIRVKPVSDAGNCHLTRPNRPELSGNEVAATACLSGLGE